MTSLKLQQRFIDQEIYVLTQELLEYQANLFGGDDDLQSPIRTQQDIVAGPTAARPKASGHKGSKHKGGKKKDAKPNAAIPTAATPLKRRHTRLYDESSITTTTTTSTSYSSTSSSTESRKKEKANINTNQHIAGGGHGGVSKRKSLFSRYILYNFL